jgi:hypothetical protein
MINKTTRGFIPILVAAFLSMVEGDDLQEINCKGKTNDSFHYHKLVLKIKQRKWSPALMVHRFVIHFNPLNAELNPICYLLALLAHHFLHVSREGLNH